MIVWCLCTTLAKFFTFFFELAYHKEIVDWGEAVLSVFNGHPTIELFIVLVILPFVLNSTMFWIQDAFLKGDKHLDARRAEQELKKRLAREERREKMCNMGKSNAQVAAAEQYLDEVSEDEFGNVVIKKRMARQIEEGVYGENRRHQRVASVVESHNDLNAVNEDEFDRILEQEKRQKLS